MTGRAGVEFIVEFNVELIVESEPSRPPVSTPRCLRVLVTINYAAFEWQKFYITEYYHNAVTGDLDDEIEILAPYRRTYLLEKILCPTDAA